MEPFITAELLFLVAYHDCWFEGNFHWMKQKCKIAKEPGYLSRFMLVQSFIMQSKLQELQQNWKTNSHFTRYIAYINNIQFDLTLREILSTILPTKFFKLALEIFTKHFNQWRSPRLFPLALAGENFPSIALAQWICPSSTNYCLPETFNSEMHKGVINLKELVKYATKNLPNPDCIKTREFYVVHSNAVKEMALNGSSLWDGNNLTPNMRQFRNYVKASWIPLPSNNQMVEAGVKDAALCRTSNHSEHFASLLGVVRSFHIHDINLKCSENSVASPPKSRGRKRKQKEIGERERIFGFTRVREVIKHSTL